MKLTLMSDLHMEFQDDIPGFIQHIVDITLESDLIALAGDIGVLACNYDDIKDLLTRLSSKGTVLYLVGNHEFYGRAFECGIQALDNLRFEFSSLRNVFINSGPPDWVKIGDFNILAGTLWFPNLFFSDYEKSCLSDFKVKGLTEYIYRYNTYYKNILEQTTKTNIITITHHAPTFNSVGEKYKGSSLNKFFCNDMDDLLQEKEVILACHGHLHDAVNYKISDTQVVSNPYGYPTEASVLWKPLVIEL